MFQNYKFRLIYTRKDGVECNSIEKENADYSVSIEENENTLKCVLHPKNEIQLKNAYLEGEFVYEREDRVFVNGYQSWTTTREYGYTDVQKGVRGLANLPFARPFVDVFGDYRFQEYSKYSGIFHSYSYTYINRNGELTLIGTTNERTGYTIFHHDMNANTMKVQKDVEGVTAKEDYVLFELYFTKGNYDKAFDAYFAYLDFPKPRLDHLAGYTSWYNYYGGINEDQINRDIDGLATVGKSADIFQIDDGYQTKVGDWYANEKFPGGMKKIVDKIHDKGYLAGLWMAPFSATFDSEVAKNHPDWLIKKPGTDRAQLGVISWGGGGTLDFYKPEVAEYIKNFFSRVVNEWGFDMVKLDFLYSICQTPRYGKSRGQIMCEGMDFLRECVGEKTLMLGCGVPLFPAFGKVDACRISCDVANAYNTDLFEGNTAREIISARNAMNNSIFRRHLNGRVFVNDPDVFYLRDNDVRDTDKYAVKKSKLKFTDGQKMLLAEINNMFGDVLFVSDNVGGYNDKQKELVKKFFKKSERKVIDARYLEESNIEVIYTENDKKYRLEFNLKDGENATKEIK